MDIEKIRKEFPFLDEKNTGKKIIYLDSAATSQNPISVINAQADYYKSVSYTHLTLPTKRIV